MRIETQKGFRIVSSALLCLLLFAVFVTACTPAAVDTSECTSALTRVPAALFPVETSDACPIDSIAVRGDITGSRDPIRVTFLAETGIQLWDEESGKVDTLFAATDVTGLKISHDHQLVAFTRRDERGRVSLWVMDADGRHPRQLLSPEQFLAMNLSASKDFAVNPYHIVWRPGTHQLAFSTLSIPAGDGMPDVFHELRVVDADSGSCATLLDDDDGGSFSYSPNGDAIAVVSDTAVSLIGADGTVIAKDIVTFPALGITDDYHHPPVIWHADAQLFTFALINTTDSLTAVYDPDVTSTIWRVSVDGSASEMATLAGMSLGHTFSPDLEQTAFMRASARDTPQREMHIADVHGAWDTVYREDDALTVPQWMPGGDGADFLYYHDGEPFLGRLCHTPESLQPLSSRSVFVHHISWVDDQRYLYLLGDQTLHLGARDGSRNPIGTVSDEAQRGVRALAIFDFSPSLGNL